MVRVLICGDSFGLTDPKYPGMHFSEKILNFTPEVEVLNLSYGGASNALILFQFLQGLNFNPDFVIFTFTSCERYELDNKISVVPKSTNWYDVNCWIKDRYKSNLQPITAEEKNIIDRYRLGVASESFERLKNYSYIVNCLTIAASKNIKFCYSLGGFEYKQEYNMLLKSNYLENLIDQYRACELKTNLWNYPNLNKSDCYFHLANDNIQGLFASECISMFDKYIQEKQ